MRISPRLSTLLRAALCLLPAACLSGCTKGAPKDPADTNQTKIEEPAPEETGGLETTGTYEGRLEARELQPVFKSKSKELYACYEEGKARNRHLQGAIRIRFEISPRGEVRVPFVEESELGDDRVERCMVDIIAKLVFPKPVGGSVLAEYPIAFRPKAVVPGSGAPGDEERAAYLSAAKRALSGCEALPASFTAAAWIDPEGQALSAGFAAAEQEAQAARGCVVEALQGARYPKAGRAATYLAFEAEELASVKEPAKKK